MKWISRTAAALALAVTLGMGAGAATASTAPAATASTASAGYGLGTLNCGPWTCSLYLSRGVTRALAAASDIGPEFRAACAGSPHRLVRAACYSLTVAVAAARWKLAQTAGKNQCLRIRFIRHSLAVVGLYSDGSRWCQN